MTPFRILLLAGAIGLMALVVLVGIHWADEPPPDDADLLPTARIVPSGEDGYGLFMEATEAFAGLSDSSRVASLSADGSDNEWLNEELKSHDEALRLLAKAVERPRIVFPPLDPLDLREGMGAGRDMARLITAHARMNLRAGETAAAFDDILFVVRLGRLLAEGGNCMIDLLTAVAVQGIALTALREEAAILQLKPEETRTLLAALDRERIPRQALAENLRGEYVVTKQMLDLLLSGSLTPGGGGGSQWYQVFGYAIKPNKTLRIVGDVYRTGIELVEETVYDQTAWPDEEDLAQERSLPLENAMGRYMVEISLPTISRVILSAMLHEANFGNNLLAIALATFENEHGRLPDSLDELAGTWIDAVPLDPFSGGPLRYSRENRMVFSIGPERDEDPPPAVRSGRDVIRGVTVPE